VIALPVGRTGEDALDVAIGAARAAGYLALERRQRTVPVTQKGRANVTTEADLVAEAAIVERLRAAFPDHDILAEESGPSGGSGRLRWVVDPIDGSFNYALGIPLYSVSIALLLDDRPLVGVIYDPSQSELFAAAAGRGATLNGQPIRNDSGRSFREAVIGYDLGYHDERARRAIAIELHLWGKVQLFRCLGSAALGLAYTAAGRFDLYFHHFLSPWDFAAGWLLVEEAGGRAFDHRGAPLSLRSRAIVAGNPAHVDEFLEATAGFGPLPETAPGPDHPVERGSATG
jgi:myo-inositol-1(or 4)-monophosphatase